jgi:hypothetical protein
LISQSKEVSSDIIWKEFKGVWHDDRNSEGTLLYESGSKYVGKLKNNKRHGRGVYTYPIVEELNKAKENNPQMRIYFNDLKRLSFSGEWEEDIKVRGLIIYRKGDKYEGQLFNDKIHGKGVFKFVSGSVYKGDFQNGVRDGYGIETYYNGSKYEGSWYKDKKHGIGEFISANEEIHKGRYANNKRNGMGFDWYTVGDLYQGTYKDHKRHGLFMINFKVSGDTGFLEYQDGYHEGLYA